MIFPQKSTCNYHFVHNFYPNGNKRLAKERIEYTFADTIQKSDIKIQLLRDWADLFR